MGQLTKRLGTIRVGTFVVYLILLVFGSFFEVCYNTSSSNEQNSLMHFALMALRAIIQAETSY